MKKVQRTLAAALAAMMLMALAGCSKGDVTKEVNSGLSDLKAQAAEPAVEPRRRPRQNPRPTRHPNLHPNLHRSPLQRRSRKLPPSRPLLPLLRTIPIIHRCRPEHPDFGGIRHGLYAGAQCNLPRPRLVQARHKQLR